jgi:hypothetical protein
MKHLALAFAMAALALPVSAFGKGPSAASIDGPGGAGITFSGDGESGGTALGNLAQQTGLFFAAFAQEPDPMLAARPKGDLGPRYTITWTVPGPSNEAWKLRQDVYPYAEPAPVTYMEPGQAVYDRKTRGGWFQAGPELKTTLVDAGLPSNAPTAATSSEFPTAALVSLPAAFLLVALTAAVVVRRRTRPAAA